MLTIISGIGLLLLTLGVFSLFSLKFPKGQEAMSGMANAAVATFLVEAIHHYITGNLMGIKFFEVVGSTSGSLGGCAAAILVPISMGVNPIFAVVAGVAVGSYGILPGFIAGYVVGFVAPFIEKHLPEGLDIILGALVVAPLARFIAMFVDPGVTSVLEHIGVTISAATSISPILMGLLLGGIMKMICTSPLSSMALTAMLGLTGLPMGIAAIACVGGSFTNGMVFHRMKFGNKSNVIAVMMEPLTQADIVTSHPLPIYCSNFFGGGLSGIGAALLGIVNNAPGTASPIPGLLAPFAFNPIWKVLLAVAIAAVCGTAAGYVGSSVFLKLQKGSLKEKLMPQVAPELEGEA
ncbi:MAG: PTS sugar transporter subunit IIC [Lachnospiraceae bacterium]|nr:PTS sugar transporter subunit IIC [Lachnospiraceae bacterium]